MKGTFQTLNSEPSFQEKTDEAIKLIDKYDATMLSYLRRLYEALNGEKIDFTKIQNAVDALAVFNQRAEYNYLNNLLHSEKCKGVKIPSPIPVPSCSFQLHNCVTLTTNAGGNLAFIFNPFFLGDSSNLNFEKPPIIPAPQNAYNFRVNSAQYISTLWVNNHETLNGYSVNNNWNPVNIGQCIPNVYDQYRLVSASIVVKYIGRMDITSGVIGGAIMYDDTKYVGSYLNCTIVENDDQANVTSYNPDLAKYGNFDLAMDSFYHQENLCLEGIRELYFPLDNSYEEYTQLGNINKSTVATDSAFQRFTVTFPDTDVYKSGFNYFVYVMGAPPSSACFKLDIYCNFECLPNSSFLNYLPLSMNPDTISANEKKAAIATVQQKPVMSTKEANAMIVSKPSIWEKLKNKFKNALPGIGKLIANGIVSMIPGLKPGLALAGTLIGMNNNQPGGTMEEEVE